MPGHQIAAAERPAIESAHENCEFLTVDPRMLQIKELCDRVARTDVPVLIMGESGVGKEVIARYIHDQSNRRKKAFVKINCAAVPHDLLESELFGHERGAFTGAHQRKEGKFELAQGGTILLDEIGEMSPMLQAKLLHVLEDWVFTRVGGNTPIHIDSRIMATTNKPLEEACKNGEFREDLYHRLKVIRILVPPLRERKADIPMLSNMFAERCADESNPFGMRIPDQLQAAFLRYDWPGNVRELKHVIQRYTILPDADMVMSELETPRPDHGCRSGADPARQRQDLPQGDRRAGGGGGGEAGDLPGVERDPLEPAPRRRASRHLLQDAPQQAQQVGVGERRRWPAQRRRLTHRSTSRASMAVTSGKTAWVFSVPFPARVMTRCRPTGIVR